MGGVSLNALTMVLLYGDRIKSKSFIFFYFTQATIFQQWTPGSLRGYGCGTPNGVLGSISLLIQSYIALWVLYKVLHGKRFKAWIVVFAGSLTIASLFPLLKNLLPTYVYKVFDATIIPSFRLFLIGALIAEFFDIIMPFIKKYWYLFLIGYVLMKHTGIPDIHVNHPIIRSVFIGLATLGFGYAFPKAKIKHDITYGIFIYHMIVINALITIGFTGTVTAVLISFFITVILAILSYKTIGTFSLKMKEKR